MRPRSFTRSRLEQFNRYKNQRVDASEGCPTPVVLVDRLPGPSPCVLLVRCKRRRCPACGPSYWLPLTKAKLLSGLPRADGVAAVGVTLTAPGDPLDIDEWNQRSGACWNRLRLALRRRYPSAEFYRVIEFQQRGAIHLHVIVRGVKFIPHGMLKGLAVAAGFGPVCWLTPYHQRGAIVRYLSKYLLKDTDLVPGGFRVFSESRGWRLDWNRPVVFENSPGPGRWLHVSCEERAFVALYLSLIHI